MIARASMQIAAVSWRISRIIESPARRASAEALVREEMWRLIKYIAAGGNRQEVVSIAIMRKRVAISALQGSRARRHHARQKQPGESGSRVLHVKAVANGN
jgi:hypothetical protein